MTAAHIQKVSNAIASDIRRAKTAQRECQLWRRRGACAFAVSAKHARDIALATARQRIRYLEKLSMGPVDRIMD